ncbi:MAG: DMT family transporter [Rhodospirillaceae bacterium]|jgi:drug/metabolite transporter (DMT)-like permease|nr:DMT family transporter [Rhodospirillaceae bacterium]MBT5665636.1 DMT family transporter [Rhodospirillaceae bacterium]MBT5812703.1 DMT family transporter [Rhodospirillaceae bacterium]
MIDATQVLALTAALFFGLALVLTQFGLRYRLPIQGAAISIPASTLLFVAAAPAIIDFGQWDWRAALIFAAVGCLYPAAVTVLTFQSNRQVGPNVAGAVGNLAPVFAVAFAAVMLGAPPRWLDVGGIAVIVFGVTLMFTGPGARRGAWSRWALLAPLGAALIRGIIQPGVKIGLETWPDPFAAAFISYIVSATVVLVLSVWRDPIGTFSGDRRGFGWFAAVGFCNGIAVLTMYAALARGDVAAVAPLVASYPVATLAFSALLLGHVTLSRRLVLGVAITVAGVVVMLAAKGA